MLAREGNELMSSAQILDYIEYRAFLRDYLKAQQISQRQLCLEASINTSYFSKVMADKAELSEVQLFAIAKYLKLNDWQVEYLLLMGTLSRTAMTTMYQYTYQKLNQIRATQQNLLQSLRGIEQDAIALEAYYEQAVTARVHIALTIPRYAVQPEQLRLDLGLSREVFQLQIQKLIGLGLVRKHKNQLMVVKATVHLDQKHPASERNHKNWRVETLAHLHRGGSSDDDYHFSALFSCDRESCLKINRRIKACLVEIQNIVSEAQSCDQVYHLGIDLYQ